MHAAGACCRAVAAAAASKVLLPRGHSRALLVHLTCNLPAVVNSLVFLAAICPLLHAVKFSTMLSLLGCLLHQWSLFEQSKVSLPHPTSL